MVSERNRIIDLVKYIESCGVTVNLGKNKARGNKGVFRTTNGAYRIDVAKGCDENSMLQVLIHEFTHFIHYSYDKSLKSLDFIIKDNNTELEEEMLSLTVETISKNSVEPIFKMKKALQSEIKMLVDNLKQIIPDFKASEKNKFLELKINKKPYKHLLKHDVVKVIDFFSTKIYKISELENIDPNMENAILYYLQLKSKQRKLNRINSRISKLNKYYNSATELLARSVEIYITNKPLMQQKAPNLLKIYDNIVIENKIPMFTKMVNFCI